METQRFLNMLEKLQVLQRNATLGGIYSFELKSCFWKADPDLGDEPDEFVLYVTVFKTGDDSDEDYARFEFHEYQSTAEWFQTYNRLRYFVEG